MKERPILFSNAMVDALLRGCKTQTRRIMEIQPPGDGYVLAEIIGDKKKRGKLHWVKTNKEATLITDDQNIEFTCPYGQVGDCLWVRETFAIVDNIVKYKVDNPKLDTKWKASIFMPRAASRILLKFTGVKIERLNDILDDDALEEGLSQTSKDGFTTKYGIPDKDGWPGHDNWGWDWQNWNTSPRKAYKFLWEKINGIGSWGVNPLVWVISFEVVEVKK
jgi:hypothetical protein